MHIKYKTKQPAVDSQLGCLIVSINQPGCNCHKSLNNDNIFLIVTQNKIAYLFLIQISMLRESKKNGIAVSLSFLFILYYVLTGIQ